MDYQAFRSSFKDFTVFSIRDIRLVESGFHRRRLNEWQDKGYNRKVIRGYYIFADLPIDEMILFETANRIYKFRQHLSQLAKTILDRISPTPSGL